jgi:hypothetical protein
MTAIKPILRQFVSWMENVYGHLNQGAASEFALEPPASVMALPECALELALSSKRPVFLASTVPVRSIISALFLRRAGITMQQVFRAELTEEHFDALADALGTAKNSRLLIEMQVEQPGPDACADH